MQTTSPPRSWENPKLCKESVSRKTFSFSESEKCPKDPAYLRNREKRDVRKWQPSPVFLPGESHGWRSLAGYSPLGSKESDMTERLHFHFLASKEKT